MYQPFEQDNDPAPPFDVAALPAGLNGQTNPVAAVEARKRDNAKRDAKRREGAQALKVVKSTQAPPAPPATPKPPAQGAAAPSAPAAPSPLADPGFLQYVKTYGAKWDPPDAHGMSGGYNLYKAYQLGLKPDSAGHLPSTAPNGEALKSNQDPRTIVNGVDTRTGYQVAPPTYTGQMTPEIAKNATQYLHAGTASRQGGPGAWDDVPRGQHAPARTPPPGYSVGGQAAPAPSAPAGYKGQFASEFAAHPQAANLYSSLAPLGLTPSDVTSVSSGEHHVKHSAHFDGRAIDVGTVGGQPIGDNPATINLITKRIQQGGLQKIGSDLDVINNPQVQAAAKQAGVELFEDSVRTGATGTHIHFQVAGGSAGPQGASTGTPAAQPGPPPGSAVAPPMAPTGIGKNSATDPVPQYQPPKGPAPQLGPPVDPATGQPMAAPQETAPAFTPAKYVPPAKGLEYLALGVGLLFPGAPIARLATGVAQGLKERADTSYKRHEQEAEDQYKAKAAQAQADYNNAVQKYGVASDEAKRAYVNQQSVYGVAEDHAKADYDNKVVKYKAAQDARARGIDPRTQKPFIVPPALQKPPPPQAGAAGYAQYENGLAQFYTSVGATDLAAQHDAEAKAYNAQVKEDATNARQMGMAIYREQSEDNRANNRENREDARTAVREAHQDARTAATTAGKLPALKDEAMRASQAFYADWAKALKPPTNPDGTPRPQKNTDGTPKVGADGTPIFATPQISPQAAQVLSKTFSLIDRDSDPAGTAMHYADTTTDPVQKEMLLARGRAADLTRRSKGMPILPHGYAPIPKAAASAKMPAADVVKQAHALGKSDDEIRAALKADGYPDADIQKAFGPPAPPVQLPQALPGTM